MDLMNKYPRLTDLLVPAARRIPKFVFAYLDSGTGQDHAKDNNRAYLDGIELTPQFMRGRVNPNLSTQLFDVTYNVPFGVAPVGLSSLIWPGAESILGAAAKAYGFLIFSAPLLVSRLKWWHNRLVRWLVSTVCPKRPRDYEGFAAKGQRTWLSKSSCHC